MKTVQAVLKQKMTDLQVIQKEIDALQLVIRLLAGAESVDGTRAKNSVSVVPSLSRELTSRDVPSSSGERGFVSEMLSRIPEVPEV